MREQDTKIREDQKQNYQSSDRGWGRGGREDTRNKKMHRHCVLNIPPHLQDTFYIAMNSAILAMKNKKEHRESPPPYHVLSMCFLPR